MMLSVLIVNYNVRYFLEHCLLSVLDAIEHIRVVKGWESEILVIDNASTDRSLDYLQPLFPSVKFVGSETNLGFGKANNLLLKKASGQYILYLNPDTLVPFDCFLKTIHFLESVPGAGACGVKMIDGSGNYLPESKRGFPGPWNSFSKMTGLIRVFPRSRVFAGYYQGNLDENKTQEVVILSGAFMMVRASVIEKTGGFDERFFMYAEDIDLSYRIQQSGFVNHYFADTTIIHFKGESTSKDVVYTKRFYTAMIQFVEKHFNGPAASGYILLLKAMIKFKSVKASSLSGKTAAVAFDISDATVAGDPAAIRALSAVRKQGLSERADPGNNENNPRAVLFCLGNQFSVSDLTREMETKPGQVYKIFHSRAGAIIGSDSRASQGTIEIVSR
ncbi:MAG: glycosyltransferase family 2 protein [Chitinophagaceae bacterium]|nr:MAG: glycosyltransferase family 2 protein [Chitinophagaceae bacterium]